MSIAEAKKMVKKIIFPENTHEQVYVINLDELQADLVFTDSFKPLGKWYITNGKHWICHSELSFEDFQEAFLKRTGLNEKDSQSIEFTIDYLPFSEILG
ncbi:DUF3884 family protein [Streptococcus devriesei]|uniref:DUF3884 family protein n=1 Tax=Streptococcus devriesei TaxID=231233 RepID=UPI00040D0F91|nr:DUF3884 family protein [Streptococcus devriesei]